MLTNVKIEPVLNGYVVRLGCQRVVFTDRQHMTRELCRYYERPDEVAAEYLKNAVNRPGACPTAAVGGWVCEAAEGELNPVATPTAIV